VYEKYIFLHSVLCLHDVDSALLTGDVNSCYVSAGNEYQG